MYFEIKYHKRILANFAGNSKKIKKIYIIIGKIIFLGQSPSSGGVPLIEIYETKIIGNSEKVY